MTSLFIDTWGWINIFNRREPHHKQIDLLYRDIRKTNQTIVISDYILDEVYTLLFKRVHVRLAQEALEALSTTIQKRGIKLIWITPERFNIAQKLRIKYHDKPDISFTDLTSMVVMQEFKISHILTADAHFTHVGLGFVLIP